MTFITTSAYQTREKSHFLCYPGRINLVDRNFYPRVKSRISLSGVQEKTNSDKTVGCAS